ncbi:phage tail protein [Anaerocolumna xylanovorans]|uniref:Microcystin-dependent protein n=1 Tax=Anaerocolumna xylanovorans DSM 12503 TaxID=1121345 RepID=A0A1M7YFJ6_9FIRM|nr:tail fiber protein [Anaerocolumna xylanovorans]SHO51383.1 Microcystin-dependent protein [Anaerocolumna xylanovorans DSM 12503]
MDFYLGMIIPWAINFEPEGFMLCDGRTLPIAQYQALYALIGNYYGGDGRTNFALPNLRGRFPLGCSQTLPVGTSGNATSDGRGTASVTANVALTAANIPGHTHTFTGTPVTADFINGSATVTTSIPATTDTATGTATNTPAENAIFGVAKSAQAPFAASNIYRTGGAKNVDMAASSSVASVSGSVTVTAAGNVSSPAGNPVPVAVNGLASITYPFLAINYYICVQGLFPSRQ